MKPWMMVVLIGLAAVFVIAAQESEPIIDVPIDTIIRGAPGEVVPITTILADPGLACETTLRFTNNEQASLHPGNGIIVGTAFYADIENGNFPAAGVTKQWETNGDILVAIRLGPDGVFSGGFNVTGGCRLPPVVDPPPPVDEVTSTTGTTTTTTLSPPPEGPIDTGGGAMADQGWSGWDWIISGLAAWIVGGGLLVAALMVGWWGIEDRR